MAEVLAIVGLAGNVVQFMDAGGNLILLIRELYRDGSLTENTELEKRIGVLQASLEKLKDGPASLKDSALAVLVEACFILSSDLMAILKGLRPNKQKNQLLQATSKSLKTIRRRGQMKDIERRLEKMRDAICSHLNVLLR